MKTNFIMMAVLAIGALAITSCNDDDNYIPENIYVQSFQQKYPDVSSVEWEDKQGYKVAEFVYQEKETEAWFDKTGEWLMTETDIVYTDLPVAIKSAFETGEYAAWHVDDVDKVERVDSETIYVLEIEQGNYDYDLYYNEDGTLIKVVQDGEDTEHLPLTISQKIIEKIRELYPNATSFIDFERDGSFIEIEIKDGSIYKEVYFDKNEEWAYSQWEIRLSDVPSVVMDALNNSSYKGYKTDDIDIIHTPDGFSYLFELEDGNKDIYCMISEDGKTVESI